MSLAQLLHTTAQRRAALADLEAVYCAVFADHGTPHDRAASDAAWTTLGERMRRAIETLKLT